MTKTILTIVQAFLLQCLWEALKGSSAQYVSKIVEKQLIFPEQCFKRCMSCYVRIKCPDLHWEIKSLLKVFSSRCPWTCTANGFIASVPAGEKMSVLFQRAWLRRSLWSNIKISFVWLNHLTNVYVFSLDLLIFCLIPLWIMLFEGELRSGMGQSLQHCTGTEETSVP